MNPFRSFRPKDGPLWPVALELARVAVPIGCALVFRSRRVVNGRPVSFYDVVVIDAAGELRSVAEGLAGPDAGRWCRLRSLRAFPGVGELVRALQRGACLGWVEGFIGHSAAPLGVVGAVLEDVPHA